MSAIDDAARLVSDASRTVVFTGAGMSAESGIPTFRDALTGMWAEHDPMTLASPEGWRSDRDLVWSWYADRARQVRLVEPNDGHLALARLAVAARIDGRAVSVVTQNVDDLHERAGSAVASHLHGSLFAPRCESCRRPEHADVAVADPRPACPLCGASMRPGVVWFGELLPRDDWSEASRLVEECDLLIVVGTSGVVQPAASLPERARSNGTPIIEVNPEPSALTPLATVHLEGTAAEVLPRLV
ncbi:NAD-dependent protein deacylase [Gordonia spumicola]|uniref:NAD-dependent protein deacylase n=1 Tax=Gordonia spumicola TaxID=589161 RepID=A0A7I9VA24_9ACTN|nr:NAD-dependent deacylase [Gordonia spumicola]GEE02246.1 NAD-dependent protein deacylase [Gordonia spumicola]